jgi:hypothetical protein
MSAPARHTLATDEKQERSLRLLLLYEARSLGRRFARCQLRDCLLYVALEAPPGRLATRFLSGIHCSG